MGSGSRIALRQTRNVRRELEAEIGGRRRMGQGANRYVVSTGARKVRDSLQRAPAGQLVFRALRNPPYRFVDLVDGEVVEKNDVGAGRDGFVHLLQVLGLNPDRHLLAG